MYKRIISAAIVTMMSLAALAQQGLNIERFFGDEYLSRSGISSVNVSGSQLKQLDGNITLYHSITVENDSTEADAIERAVKKDGVQAVSRTVSINDGHVVFGFYALPPTKSGNRFIIFIRNDNKPDGETPAKIRADLFYIEGKTSAEELNRIIRSVKTSK